MVKKTVSRALDKKVAGTEPEFDGYAERDEIIGAFNWYQYSYTISETKKWIIQWMQEDGYLKDDISAYSKSNSNHITQTMASIARMMTRGLIDKKLELDLRNGINKALTDIVEEVVENTPPKSNESALIADLDDYLDEFYNNKYKPTDRSIDEIIKDCKVSDMKEAHAYFTELHTEVATAEDGFDHITKAARKRYEKFVDEMLDKLKIKTTITKTRAPRKKKPKSVAQGKIADKLKYLEHHELGSSVHPTTLFSTKIIWTYNPTNRKLSKYVAGKEMLDIKGQSVLNYDPDQSFTITIRKPEETVPKIIGDGVRTLNKYVSSLKVKRAAVIARINDKTLLLRTQK